MLSVIIATRDSERALVPTLAALVCGATAGLVSDVVVADGGSQDETAAVADIAGCNFLVLEGPLGRRLRAGATAARASWFLFLKPGTVLDSAWPNETQRFADQSVRGDSAAVFRRNAPPGSGWRGIAASVAAALGGLPHPEQGLLIARQFYDALGGHRDSAADPETDLMRRIGRRRIAILSAGVVYGR